MGHASFLYFWKQIIIRFATSWFEFKKYFEVLTCVYYSEWNTNFIFKMQTIFTFTLNSKIISFLKYKLSIFSNSIQNHLLCINFSMITMGHRTCQTRMMERSCKTSSQLLAVNYFRKKELHHKYLKEP